MPDFNQMQAHLIEARRICTVIPVLRFIRYQEFVPMNSVANPGECAPNIRHLGDHRFLDAGSGI